MAIRPEERTFSGQVSEAGQGGPLLTRTVCHPRKEKALGEERGGVEGTGLGGRGRAEWPRPVVSCMAMVKLPHLHEPQFSYL